MKSEITILDKTFVPFIPYKELSAAIDVCAEKINTDFSSCKEPPILLCVLNGALMFTGELLKRLDFPLELVTVRAASYVGTASSGKVDILTRKLPSFEGRQVLMVEDIVDTGNTIVALKDYLTEAGASSIKICSMLIKPDSYKKDIPIDYVAMSIPNDFIVGFGLDYEQLGRNLKDIYVLKK